LLAVLVSVPMVVAAQYVKEPQPAPPEEAQIVFSAPPFSAVTPARFVAETMTANMETLNFDAGRYIAQIAYWKNRPGFIMFQKRTGLTAVQQSWPFLQDKHLVSIDKDTGDSHVGPIKYERFSVAVDVKCFHFDKVLPLLSGKRSHGVTGYVCKTGVERLPHAEIRELLEKLDVRGVGQSAPEKQLPAPIATPRNAER
jgi:hypothetical protein